MKITKAKWKEFKNKLEDCYCGGGHPYEIKELILEVFEIEIVD